jgi:HAMP domain-containing protein
MQATLAVPEKPRPGEEQRLNILVIATLVIALLIGWGIKTGVEGRTRTLTALGGALSLRYPATWVAGQATDETTLLTVSDPRSSAALNPTFSVLALPMPKGQRLLDVATNWALSQSRVLREFQDLGTEQTFLSGHLAVRLNYAYIADPPEGSGPATLPIVARATATFVAYGDQLLIFNAVSDASQYDEYGPRLAKIAASVWLAK